MKPKCDLPIGKPCIQRVRSRSGSGVFFTESRNVKLLAISNCGKWAMVRRPMCGPYVCSVKELLPFDQSLVGKTEPSEPQEAL